MKKLFLFFGVFLAPIFLQATDNQREFVVGMTSGYAPFVSINDKGDYEGFDIDLANALADKLGAKLVLKDLGSMPSLLLALKQKKVDAVIWAISITEERKRTMEMIYYQGDLQTTTPFLFWTKPAQEIKVIDDLKNMTVCVEAGSYQETIMRRYSSVSLKYVDKVTDAIMEIKYGKAFATTIDTSLVSKIQALFPNIYVLDLPLPLEERSLGNGIAINKENQLLSARVQEAVDSLTQEGRIRELEKKWGLR